MHLLGLTFRFQLSSGKTILSAAFRVKLESAMRVPVSRTRDLTFDAVRIGKIHTPAFAFGREAGGFESRDRIGWIVIRDAVAIVIQAGLLALEERQPAFAGGKEAFLSRRFQAKVFLIPFLRTLHIGHVQRHVIEIGGIKGGGRVRRIRCGASGLLIGERDGRAQARGKHAGQIAISCRRLSRPCSKSLIILTI